MKRTPLCDLLNIKYPIIQAGMVWVSGAKLAAASANAGCLGVIGAGSMPPDLLREHIRKAKSLTSGTIAVNFPLLYSKVKEQIDIALEEGISVFITSAGSPKLFTTYLKDKGATVIHVCSNITLAKKCEAAGVDAVIVEGFEAGGHNGRDELTTMVLLPEAVRLCRIPVIAAGGFSSGASILAAQCLGAAAIQLGTRFMMTKESSAHSKYKDLLTKTTESSTELVMKKTVPVRLVKNQFYQEIKELEMNSATAEELLKHLGKGRAKKGMFEGDLKDGELEAGQICYALKDLPTVSELVAKIKDEYAQAKDHILG